MTLTSTDRIFDSIRRQGGVLAPEFRQAVVVHRLDRRRVAVGHPPPGRLNWRMWSSTLGQVNHIPIRLSLSWRGFCIDFSALSAPPSIASGLLAVSGDVGHAHHGSPALAPPRARKFDGSTSGARCVTGDGGLLLSHERTIDLAEYNVGDHPPKCVAVISGGRRKPIPLSSIWSSYR